MLVPAREVPARRRRRRRRSTPAPATAIAAPASRRPRASAYQIPSPAIGSPISSPVDMASTAHTAKGTSRSVSRNQMQKRKSGIANVTGWIEASRRSSRSTGTRGTRVRGLAAVAPIRGAGEPSQNTGSAPSETTAICASASESGDGHTIHSGASSTRNGSACHASRTICSPVAPCVFSSGRPRSCSRRPAPCSRGRTARSGTPCRRRDDDEERRTSKRAIPPRR